MVVVRGWWWWWSTYMSNRCSCLCSWLSIVAKSRAWFFCVSSRTFSLSSTVMSLACSLALRPAGVVTTITSESESVDSESTADSESPPRAGVAVLDFFRVFTLRGAGDPAAVGLRFVGACLVVLPPPFVAPAVAGGGCCVFRRFFGRLGNFNPPELPVDIFLRSGGVFVWVDGLVRIRTRLARTPPVPLSALPCCVPRVRARAGPGRRSCPPKIYANG